MAFHKKKLNKFLDIGSLSSSAFSEELPRSSFVFVTYNRCPEADFSMNPLIWAIQTLVENKGYDLDEIIVVDDCSTDYTPECVTWLQGHCPISIRYHKNIIHKDMSFSRTVGLQLAQNKLVFLGDDDCLYSQYFLLGSVLSFKLLETENENVALINLNMYEKATYPRFCLPSSQIGKSDFSNAFFVQNFNAFPAEYINYPQWLEEKFNLLRPLDAGVYNGVSLCNRELILEAGGYQDLSMWKFGYSEHLELSHRLLERGSRIFHQPDPKIYAIHLHYGGKSRGSYDKRCYRNYIKGPEKSLKQLVAMAEITRLGSGTRCTAAEFHHTEIGTFFSFYLKISISLGVRFAIREYEYFVNKHHVFSATPNNRIDSQEERKTIWENAIKHGIYATELQLGKTYPRLFERILASM